MPERVIFREVEEFSGITLEEYLITLSQLSQSSVPKATTEASDMRVEAGTGVVN
jgi:hypothetical protein